eukprot:1309957-Rhodomonas_salina.1
MCIRDSMLEAPDIVCGSSVHVQMAIVSGPSTEMCGGLRAPHRVRRPRAAPLHLLADPQAPRARHAPRHRGRQGVGLRAP